MVILPTKEEFEAFEETRQSGRINMFDVAHGCMLSGLDRETWRAVMNNYDELNKLYPDVRGSL